MSPSRTVTHEEWVTRAAALAPRTQLFVDGAFRDARSGATMASVTPRDGSLLADVCAAQVEDVDDRRPFCP